MVTVPVGLTKTRQLRVASDRRIYRTTNVDTTRYANGYRKRLPFIVTKSFSVGNLTDIPVRFRVSDAALKVAASGGFLQTGNDMLFTTIGGTPLTWKREEYVGTSGLTRGKFIYPSLSIANINAGYLYFDNPDQPSLPTNGNPDAGYVAACDLPVRTDLAAGTMSFGSDFVTGTSMIGVAAAFDGTSGATRACPITPLVGRSAFVVEVILNATDLAAAYEIFTVGSTKDVSFSLFNVSGSDNSGAQLRFQGATAVAEYRFGSGTFEAGVKHHYLCVYQSTGQLALYRDGEPLTPIYRTTNVPGNFAPTAGNTTLTLGGVNFFFKGIMDGWIIHQSFVSSTWAHFQFTQASYGSTICNFGAYETPGVINDVMENFYIYSNQTTPTTINTANMLYSAVNRVPTITSFTAPSNGTMVASGSAALIYTPSTTFVGDLTGFTINVTTA